MSALVDSLGEPGMVFWLKYEGTEVLGVSMGGSNTEESSREEDRTFEFVVDEGSTVEFSKDELSLRDSMLS